jgi:hypothetical protein
MSSDSQAAGHDGAPDQAAHAQHLLALMPYAVALGIELESVSPDLAIGHSGLGNEALHRRWTHARRGV